MKIGFFDSGIGGLTVLKEALKQAPGHDYLYYADTEHAPYGPKPKEEVQGYVRQAIGFLIEKGAEVVVIACNTATSIGAAEARETYGIPIIGMEPAVKPALEISKDEKTRVLVTATPLTLREEKMKQLLAAYDPHGRADLCPLPGLVVLAEAFDFRDESVIPYLEKAFAGLDLASYGSAVLGCTHFPLFTRQFKQLLPGAVLVDGAEGTVKNLLTYLHPAPPGEGAVTFYRSGQPIQEESELAMFRSCLFGT